LIAHELIFAGFISRAVASLKAALYIYPDIVIFILGSRSGVGLLLWVSAVSRLQSNTWTRANDVGGWA
jgi:hypothetical protein